MKVLLVEPNADPRPVEIDGSLAYMPKSKCAHPPT